MKSTAKTTEDQARLKLYLRLILSYGDFKHAKRCAEYLLSEHELLSKQHGDDLTLRALYYSMIVSYARPFNSKGKSRLGRVPPLGREFRRVLTADEASLHDYILFLRNRVVAHTDAELADLLPYVASDLPGEFVIPEINGTREPFTLEASRAARDLADKALTWAILERRKLEPQVLHLFERRPLVRVESHNNT